MMEAIVIKRKKGLPSLVRYLRMCNRLGIDPLKNNYVDLFDNSGRRYMTILKPYIH